MKTWRVLLVPQDDSAASIVTTEASTLEFRPLVDDVGCDYTFFADSGVFAGSRSFNLDTHTFNARASALVDHLIGRTRAMPIYGPAVFVSLDADADIVDIHGRLLEYARTTLNVAD